MPLFQRIPKCPRCDDLLLTLELKGVEIDHCPKCRGTWLDSGELEDIAIAAGAEDASVTSMLEGLEVQGKGKLRCVRCGRKMRTAKTAEEGKIVEVDFCPKSHGYWFDRGEMNALMAGCDETTGSAVARFFTDLYRCEVEPD